MNKLSTVIKSLLVAICMVGVTFAEESHSSSVLMRWTGFYAGIEGGITFNDVQLRSQQLGFISPSETCNSHANFSSFYPGIQVGYMYQLTNDLISGIEANFSFYTRQQDTFSCHCDTLVNVSDRFSFRNRMQSTIKGRLGRALNWQQRTFFPYLTVGTSFTNVMLAYKNEGGDHYANRNTHAGWLVGIGLEWSLKQHWSLRAEYNYANYGKTIKLNMPNIYGLIDPNGKAHIDLNTNNINLALNYWM